jgi:hypothetical protein
VPLRTLLEGTAETVQDLALAAEERYWEAYELVVQGHPFAGAYLIGYTAEMLLKTAAFRFDGALPGDFVAPRLGPAKSFGTICFPSIPYESAHSLRFWVAFLERKRADAGRPLPAALHAELGPRVDRVYGTWWVSMRYRSAMLPASVFYAAQAEALGLLEDVDWLRRHHSDLWS